MAKDDGKLGRILGLLDAAAIERLRLFLRSPAHNRSKQVLALAEALCAPAPPVGDEALFQAVAPGEPLDPTKLKNLRAALQRKLDDFLAQEAFHADPALQSRLLLRQLNVLNERQYFERYHQRAWEALASSPIEEEQRQLGFAHLAEEWETAQIRLGDRGQSQQSVSAYHHAWQYFQLQTVKYLVRQANLGAIVGESADTADAEQVLALLRVDETALPSLRMYRQLLDVFRHPEEPAHFVALRAMLSAQASMLASVDASDLYTGAINHCIRRINAGHAAFATDMLALYKEMDALGLLLLHGRLPAAQFKNMVGLALRFKAYEWAQDVIDRYGGLLDQDRHGTAAHFNQGMLDFAQERWAQAERSFNRVLEDFEDVFYGLDARSYLLRVHYQSGNWLGLESLVESFKMYLKRNRRIPKTHRDSYLRTATFFGKLAKVSHWNKAGLLRLRREVERTAFAATSKQWILAKLDELQARGRP